MKSVTSFLNSFGFSACTQCPVSNSSRTIFGKYSFASGILREFIYRLLLPFMNNVCPSHVLSSGSYWNPPISDIASPKMEIGMRKCTCGVEGVGSEIFVKRNARIDGSFSYSVRISCASFLEETLLASSFFMPSIYALNSGDKSPLEGAMSATINFDSMPCGRSGLRAKVMATLPPIECPSNEMSDSECF